MSEVTREIEDLAAAIIGDPDLEQIQSEIQRYSLDQLKGGQLDGIVGRILQDPKYDGHDPRIVGHALRMAQQALGGARRALAEENSLSSGNKVSSLPGQGASKTEIANAALDFIRANPGLISQILPLNERKELESRITAAADLASRALSRYREEKFEDLPGATRWEQRASSPSKSSAHPRLEVTRKEREAFSKPAPPIGIQHNLSAETASLLSGIPELSGDLQPSVYSRPLDLGTDQRPVNVYNKGSWDAYSDLLNKFELEEYLEDPALVQKFSTETNLIVGDGDTVPLHLDARAFEESSNPNWSRDRQLFFVEMAQDWLQSKPEAGVGSDAVKQLKYENLLVFLQNPNTNDSAGLGPLAGLEAEARKDFMAYMYAVWWASTNQLLVNAEERYKLDREIGGDPAKLAARYQPPLTAVEMNIVRPGLLRGHELLNRIFQGDKKQHVIWGELSKHMMKVLEDPNLRSSYEISECDPETMHLSGPQRFLLKYFKPPLPIKGMVLWWSVGSGKTCAGVSLASVNFDPAGWYTMWVTKKTLRGPIYDAIFAKTKCHAVLNEKGVIKSWKSGMGEPQMEELLVNNSRWVETTSYEQFSNWCDPSQLQSTRRSKFNARMRKNGDDPAPLDQDALYKTFIAIDEAQFLFDKSKMEVEKGIRVEYIVDAIYKSYEVSGINSCRLLLFTATPLIRHPMDFIRLLNLLQPDPTMRVADEKGNEYTDEDFDRFYLVDSKLSGTALAEAQAKQKEFVETMIMPKLFRNMYGKISYVNVTGSRPAFPGFTTAQTVYVPVSKLQIADALNEGSKGAQLDGDCTSDDSLKVAKCMKRVDLATQAFREFALTDATLKVLKDNQEFFRKYLVQFSPKLTAALNMIQEYNRRDWTKYGHLFKMAVYLPFTNPLFTQVAMSVFRLYNYGLGVWFKPGEMRIIDRPLDKKELDPYTPDPGGVADNRRLYAPNMAVIVEGSINGYKMKGSVKDADADAKKSQKSDYNVILDLFNKRSEWGPDGQMIKQGNEYGEWAQILLISGPFREGIDVYDCKRWFQISPEESVPDGIQALGRVQRRCGNKGLILRTLRERGSSNAAAPIKLKNIPAGDPLVLELTSMDYIEFRSYLPSAIVNPRTKEEVKVGALDEINRESFKTGFFIENLSMNPALNQWSIGGKASPSGAYGSSGSSPVDDPLEPGKRFVGTQKEFLEKFYKAWNQRPDDISRSALVSRYAIRPEVLRSQFLSPLVYGGGGGASRRDQPLVRAGYSEKRGSASPLGSPSRRGRGAGSYRSRYGGRAASPRGGRQAPARFRAGIARGGRAGKFSVKNATPYQLRHALLQGITKVGQNEIDAFVEKYEIKNAVGGSKWILDELYVPELAKETGKYASINNHILTSAAVLSVDYWLMKHDSDPMYSPPDLVTMITAKTALGVPTQTLTADDRMVVTTADIQRPLQSKTDVQGLASVVVPDYTGQYNANYKVEDLPEIQQKVDEEVRATKQKEEALEASRKPSARVRE